MDKESTWNAEDTGNVGSVPGLRRSSGEGNGNPLRYSYLESPVERRSLVGCSPWGHREADATERLSLHAWREEEGTEAEPRFGDCTPE